MNTVTYIMISILCIRKNINRKTVCLLKVKFICFLLFRKLKKYIYILFIMFIACTVMVLHYFKWTDQWWYVYGVVVAASTTGTTHLTNHCQLHLLGSPLPKKISLKILINDVRFYILFNVREYGEYTRNFRSYFLHNFL